jgi:hypothetical protein
MCGGGAGALLVVDVVGVVVIVEFENDGPAWLGTA